MHPKGGGSERTRCTSFARVPGPMNNYFKGEKCNADWQELESESARKMRGRGWMTFRRIVIAAHGMKCDGCDKTLADLWSVGRTLDVHHKIKIRQARHLRFEESNCQVFCQPCHVRAEKQGPLS